MARKKTKEIKYVRLSEDRIREIESLIAQWPYETKLFMRARLNQYTPRSDWAETLIDWARSLVTPLPPKTFKILKDPDILIDWQMRFKISGQTRPREAWNKIIEKEVSARDYRYMLALLDRELSDVHVPLELERLFEKIYRAHIRKEFLSDVEIPKAPIILFTGPSGSGKTATVSRAIEQVIFANQVLPEVDLSRKKEEVLAGQPFWMTIEEVDPDMALEISRKRRLKFYKALSGIPIIRTLFRRRIGRHLSELEEQGIFVDYTMVTPNDYQTALAGEPGNYLKRAMGDPRRTAIRHIEEAHSAFGKSESEKSGAERQQRTLVDTANIIIDEITSGRRDCLLIATSDQPERFDPAIYRRFVEKGKIIDLTDYWKNPDNLFEIVRLELLRNDIRTGHPDDPGCERFSCAISKPDVRRSVDKIYAIFGERALKITPAYVRKLVYSVIEIKQTFRPEFLDDALLVRKAFELVAKNAYGDLYAKFVDRMNRAIRWDDYVGEVKNLFSEMANNCLFYSMLEEKGVVLNGPPGSGKTFLSRCWLSENLDVHDISASPGALQDPVNPIDGAVENLEKIYEIAKMIAPTVVFFDEGDALAPRRSNSGGSPSDKLTNKFLSIIDGERPLHKVFTVLTTNRLDILDPALIRSKRLKVLEISGHLRSQDIAQIIANTLTGVPLADDVTAHTIFEAAKGICNTPADYTAFVEKARSLRLSEFEVLSRFRSMANAGEEKKRNFIKLNFKTLMGILEAVQIPKKLKVELKGSPEEMLNRYGDIAALIETIQDPGKYPLMMSHLMTARKEISRSPVKKGRVQLDEFLQAELSKEPQIGFIIGVGANDVEGMVMPIATSLTYSLSPDKVLVTGAVSASSPAAAEMEMAVQMTKQSAQEAFTLVKNYLQGFMPAVSIPRLLGEFLDKYNIHHQLLSASYSVGGPSAGYALALNTLSALLHIPVYNDFGITGAPWTKGVKTGEVGGSVIIGGHRKKTEKVLMYLRRMYMPLKNYSDLDYEFLESYWEQDKDVLGVTHFGDLVPEVVWLNPEFERDLQMLIRLRIQYKLNKYRDNNPPAEVKERILALKDALRRQVESLIVRRLAALREYLQDPDRDPHLSLQEIFKSREHTRRLETVFHDPPVPMATPAASPVPENPA